MSLLGIQFLNHGGVPVGALIAFLMMALISALKKARAQRCSIWSVWLLGPATAFVLLIALALAHLMLSSMGRGVVGAREGAECGGVQAADERDLRRNWKVE
jgi:predicted histidine transporter YuiF (NhaC family)